MGWLRRFFAASRPAYGRGAQPTIPANPLPPPKMPKRGAS